MKKIRCISRFITSLLSVLLVANVPLFAQNLGQAALQERERKKNTRHALHVYTNEDLARPTILIPEDQARVMSHNGAGEGGEVAAEPVENRVNESSAWLGAAPIAPRPKDRKDMAAAIVAATPEIEIIDPGSSFSMIPAQIASAAPAFPLAANNTAPLLAPKAQILLPSLDLPAFTPNAYPNPDISMAINFPEIASSKPAIAQKVASEPLTAPALAMAGEMSAVISSFQSVAAHTPASHLIAPLPASKPDRSTARPFETTTAIVRRGDSLWKLAEQYLGDGKRWRELAKINSQLANPDLIHPGEPIYLPAPTQAAATDHEVVLNSEE